MLEIILDTETTGIHKDFSQIIQCGSIFTDINLNQKSIELINDVFNDDFELFNYEKIKK